MNDGREQQVFVSCINMIKINIVIRPSTLQNILNLHSFINYFYAMKNKYIIVSIE